MIVPMQKVTLLCLAAERDSTLHALGALGVIHLTPLQTVVDSDLDKARHVRDECDHALSILAECVATRKGGMPLSGDGSPGQPPVQQVAEVLDLDRRYELLTEQAESLNQAMTQLEPYGDFKPALAGALQARGVPVTLCRADDIDEVHVPDGAFLRVLASRSTGVYYVVIGADPGQNIERLQLPAHSLGELRTQHQTVAAEMTAIENRLQELAGHESALRIYSEELDLQARFFEARSGMGRNATVAYLRGYCPGDQLLALRDAARRNGWGLQSVEPSADDRVPTLIRMPRWVTPIKSVFDLIKISPGYREIDVSASFLIFLTIFFALIVGDAGYGLVFMGLTALARWRLSKAPPEAFRLLYIFSTATIVWGVLTGVYFGMSALPGVFAPRVHWLTENANIMSLCIFIGAVHLTVAHVWNMIRMINSVRAIAQAGWIAITWSLMFFTRWILLNQPLPVFVMPLAGAGLVAVLLFMTPFKLLKTEWVNHVMMPLTLMSNFADILSYLRLWALGVAGVQLADAFNTIVGQMWGLGWAGWLAGVVILFISHGMNIALGALSVLVHGIRLNALEFSMHIGMEWTGFEYKPFVTRQAATPAADVKTG